MMMKKYKGALLFLAKIGLILMLVSAILLLIMVLEKPQHVAIKAAQAAERASCLGQFHGDGDWTPVWVSASMNGRQFYCRSPDGQVLRLVVAPPCHIQETGTATNACSESPEPSPSKIHPGLLFAP